MWYIHNEDITITAYKLGNGLAMLREKLRPYLTFGNWLVDASHLLRTFITTVHMNTVHAHIPSFLKNHFNIIIVSPVSLEVSSLKWQELREIPNTHALTSVFQPGFRKITWLSGSAKWVPQDNSIII
jgi:hypothetical protein